MNEGSCTSVKQSLSFASGGFGWVGGGVPPLSDQIVLNFMQFLGKFNKIVSRRPLKVGVICENSGSATDCNQILSKVTHQNCEAKLK